MKISISIIKDWYGLFISIVDKEQRRSEIRKIVIEVPEEQEKKKRCEVKRWSNDIDEQMSRNSHKETK